MKKFAGILFGIWLAVTGLGVLAIGIGWNQMVWEYFGALPRVSAWTELAPLVYILWVIISGIGLIAAGGFVGAWAMTPAKKRSMSDRAEQIDLRGSS